MMKKYINALKGLALAAGVAGAALPATAQLTPGNVVVLQVGNGVDTLATTGNPVMLQEFLRTTAAQATPVSTVMVPQTGPTRLVISGRATSEGLMTLSADSSRLTFAGYDTSVTNTFALPGSASNVIPRVVDTVGISGVAGRASATQFFNGNNIRSAVSGTGDDYWAIGANSGVQYLGNTMTAASLGTTAQNIRSIQTFNGNLYFSSGSSATLGISKIAGMPMTAGVTETLIIPTGTGSSPFDFAVNAAETIVYIADARAVAGGGIQKWVLTGGTWTVADTLVVGAGARGLIVDWSAAHPELYATTTDNRLVMVTDSGYASGMANTWTTLATAPLNTRYGGVAFSPKSSVACTSPTLSTTTTPVSCSGNGSVTLTVTGGSPVSSYFWTGANGFTASTPNLTNVSAGTYTVVVNASGCTATTSATVTSTATVSAAATALGMTTFCSGDSVILKADTGTGYAFQWYDGTTAIAGATDTTYTVTTSGSYTVQVANGGCSATSNAIPVTVNPSVNVTVTAAGNTTFCQGDSVMLNATGVSGVTYQWFRNGAPINGANGASIYARNNGQFRVYVTNGSCTDTSAPILVTVYRIPNATIAANTPLSFCLGDSVKLMAMHGAGPGFTALTYQWNLNGNPISNSIDSTLTVTNAGSYSVIITNGTCGDTSAPAQVTVHRTPTATIAANVPIPFCAGTSLTLMAMHGTGTGFNFLSYQWTLNGNPIPGAMDSTLITTGGGNYAVIITNAGTCADTSAVTTLMANPLPAATVSAASSTTFCAGDSVILMAATTAGASYKWLIGGTLVAGATNSNYLTMTAGAYSVIVTSAAGCTDTSAATTVMVNPLPTPTVAYNGAVLTVPNATGYTNFKWFLNGSTTPIAGATSATYTPAVSGNYTVSVDSNGCPGTSTFTNVTLGVSGVAQSRLTVSPNPAQNAFEILPAGAYQVRITDVQGRTVLNAETTSRVDISLLAEGLYLLHIRTPNGEEAVPVKLLKK